MRGSAIWFVQQIPAALNEKDWSPADVDLIFTSDMTPVADLKALLPDPLDRCPIVCYFHENQLTYPVRYEDMRDFQYSFTNITSCLASDSVWFNSNYHRDSFLTAVEELLAKMPDFVPEGIPDQIQSKSKIMRLGLDEDLFVGEVREPPKHDAAMRPMHESDKVEGTKCPPTIVWNHRWEYDKNPDDFFEALFDLDRAGIDFRLIVLGEQFREGPAIFEAARQALDAKILHFGYAESRADYVALLQKSDIVVSTAIHEFYGLAVLEAIAAGCTPLLPHRLSYPELIPPPLHQDYLYANGAEFRNKLEEFCTSPPTSLENAQADTVRALSWLNLIKRYDTALDLAST